VGGRTGAGVEVLSGTPPCEPTSYVNAGITGLPLLPASAIATVVARRRGVDALGAAHGRCGRRCDSGCARPATGATRAARVSIALVTPSARGTCTRPIDSHGAQGCVPVTSTLCTPPPARSAPQHRRSHLSPGRDPRVDVGGRTGSIIQRTRNVTVPAHRHITVPCPRALATPGTAWSTFNPWRQPLGAPWVVGCTYTYGLTHDDRAATHTHQPATRPPAWQWEDPAEGVQADPQRLSSSSGLKPSLLRTSRGPCERVDR